MIGDVIYPVETNFISQCVKLDMNRQFDGPYPLCDISSIENIIPYKLKKELESYENSLLKEYPDHNPINDATRCGLKWIFAKNKIKD